MTAEGCMNCTLGIGGLSREMSDILGIKVHGRTTKLRLFLRKIYFPVTVFQRCVEGNSIHLLKYKFGLLYLAQVFSASNAPVHLNVHSYSY